MLRQVVPKDDRISSWCLEAPKTMIDLIQEEFIEGGLNAESGPYDSAPVKDWADKADEWQQAALQSQLGIPLILGVDAIHGHNNAYGTTIFPHNVGLGATRDAELIQRIGAATALEARAGGINYAFAPCVAVVKDVRWNRCYESYSEDPEIVGRMASIITSLQGLPPAEHPKGHPFVAGRNNVIACAKHFVGDGGTEGGKNEGDTRISYDELETVHMAPYLDCISQHVCTVMASYSSYNGQKMHSHEFLLTDVLKNKLGFKGFVISDWRGIDRLKDNRDSEGAEYRVCAALGINAGIDMVLGRLDLVKFQEGLISLVEAGEVPISRIDDAVERILRVKFAAGIFEHPFSDRSLLDLVGCKGSPFLMLLNKQLDLKPKSYSRNAHQWTHYQLTILHSPLWLLVNLHMQKISARRPNWLSLLI
ncbi:hypothetical protein CRG98_036504 [Punica granatum]|uniref:Glycoside hydrolase family 3 N-terminal domain-containing protein n=1 Tax=Punica granatum TaxID=22663 RepID=A0A2I0IGI3_PUNGR|nr:hypothetical protein CRG98_036504 [Punica granatum]